MIKFILSKILRFFYRLLSKIIYFCIPFISRILILLKLNSRIINQLNKLRSESHQIDDHGNLISKLLGDKKLVALDVGVQGGFFNSSIFNKEYNNFFAPVEVDMIFIPNYLTDDGKKLILSREKEFVSLMLIFGHIKLLQIISAKLNFCFVICVDFTTKKRF